MRGRYLHSLGACLLAATLLSGASRADPIPLPRALENPRAGFFEPVGPERWRLRVAVGATMDVFPRRLVASELRQVPMVFAGLRLGLPAGLRVEARLRAVVLNNELSLGIGWGRRFGDFSLGAHYNAALWFGFMGVEGFDVSSRGLTSQPGISVGLRRGRTQATLSLEVIVVHSQRVNLAGVVISRDLANLGGVALSLVAETRVNSRGHMVYYGVTVLNTVPDYQLWLAFAPSQALLTYPRFVAGYEF